MARPSPAKLLSLKKPEDVSDEMPILADVWATARVQVTAFVIEAPLKHRPREKAVALATVMTDGRWTLHVPLRPTMPEHAAAGPGPRAGHGRLPLAELPARS